MKEVVAGFVLVCCGYGQAELATKQMLSALRDMSAALESVKDKETAKAAAPKIEAAVARLQQAKTKADGIKGTKAENEKLEKVYVPKVLEALTRLQKAALSAGRN